MSADGGDGVWVGIDLGTQSVRAVAVTDSGEVAGSGSAALRSRRTSGHHEQDPRLWWSGVATACRTALAEVPAASVRGIAVDGTSGTVLLVDDNGLPLTPALMYDDGRAQTQTRTVNEVGGAVWEALGYRRMQPSWALPKLLWLLHEHPEAGRRGRLAHQVDVINRHLVGAPVASDLSNALKSGAHLVDEEWPHEVMQALGVPTSLLPPLVRPGSLLGHVGAEGAEATGLPLGTPVRAGMTDGCAAQIGSGALRPGSWNSVLGTTFVLKGVTEQLLHDPAGVVYSHRAPDGGWLPGGASSTGAGAVTAEFAGHDLGELEQQARALGPARAVTYPLVGEGERFPFTAPAARGFTLGPTRTPVERYAAVLEGVAYVERLSFDYLRMLGAPVDGTVMISGGATRSRYWNQLRADILGRPLTLPENPEPALGMAVLAAATDGELAAVAERMVRVRETVHPRPDHAGRFDASYSRLVRALEERGWLPAAVAHSADPMAAAS
ncbi:MAG: FGGY family carbohydrate kinase [Actinomycetota bacterium]|nr:FGGY family carbohydrate kinase [Actinomycetota bacterium]